MLASYAYAVKQFNASRAALFPIRTVAPRSATGYGISTTMTEWQINIRDAGMPLIEALGVRVPAAPRALLRQLCKRQRVAVNGQVAQADQPTRAGETITVKDSERWRECLELSHLLPEQLLYEDIQCMVINKPAGLAVHYAPGHDDNLLQRVTDFLRLRHEGFRVAAIHRLDIGTSGAILIGKGSAAISLLGKMIMAGQATKRYLALIEGAVSRPGALDAPVQAKGRRKESLSSYAPVMTAGGYTLLEVELVTGRRHQIRSQLAAAGGPIVGDSRYRGKSMHGISRPFLHCHQLAFTQPATGARVEISCPLPGDLQALLGMLGFPRQPGTQDR